MRIIFIGSGDIGLPTLRMLLSSNDHHVLACVTQPDKPVGRHQELQASAIKQLALQHHVPIFQPARIRDRAVLEQLQYLRPDVIVVIAYGQILPGDVLRIPAVACLNLHASLLPRHRGAAPIHAAIEAGDPTTGITVMYMSEGLDTGDILLEKSLRIGRRETTGILHDRLAALAPDALGAALALLKQGRAPRLPQVAAEATYAAKLTRENGEIRWTATREEIDRKIRAMTPWPSAYTFIPTADGPRKLKVFSSILHSRRLGEPGTVARADKHGILVAAAEGGLLLREVQIEGKKRMSARDFLLGNPVAAGTLLGIPAPAPNSPADAGQ
ncbi:MAG: Methionyl-tRNA formyltransferase [Chthoniobacteraceae bacterium]|nr:Methionyl-tRNA formyltransferase [Chthoniobacteraceae bacterium]